MSDLCGWTEREINEDVARLLAQPGADRDLILELAAEARLRGNSWPLRPKPVNAAYISGKRVKEMRIV